MKVYIEKEQKRVEIAKSCTGAELLKQLEIPETTVLIVRNGEVALPDENLKEDDDIQLLSVVSGG